MAVLNNTTVNGNLNVTEEITQDNGKKVAVVTKDGKSISILNISFSNGVLTITTTK